MGAPNAFIPVALAAFVPATFACIALLGPRRGAMVALLAGWLFLPVFDYWYEFPLLHTKRMFVPGVVLAASIALDSRSWTRFRPRLIDVPMAAFCLVPFASSLLNELPWYATSTGPYYDAFSAVFEAFIVWGGPYLLGRLYLGEPKALGEFATWTAASALVYVPFCLFELRMSPQLHRIVYGFHQHSFVQHMRAGGFRPMVFMEHGLMVAMFMASGTLAAYWLWRTRARRTLAGLPLGWLCVPLAVTTIACKSLGAIILLGLGIVVVEGTRRLRTSALILALLAIPPTYCAARLAGWSPEEVVRLTRERVSGDRAESFGIRASNENVLIGRALLKPWVGWGRWGGYRAWDEEGKDIVITDGLWILTLGKTGFVGLLAFWLAFVLPVVGMLGLFPARHWGDPRLAPAAALAVIGLLYLLDDLLNAMMTPMAIAIPGALVSLCLLAAKARSARLRAARARTGSGRSAPSWAEGYGR